jgi:hypothetical protein
MPERVASYSITELRKFRHVGPKTIKELHEFVTSNGLKFKPGKYDKSILREARVLKDTRPRCEHCKTVLTNKQAEFALRHLLRRTLDDDFERFDLKTLARCQIKDLGLEL